jgi:hypothetical protein
MTPMIDRRAFNLRCATAFIPQSFPQPAPRRTALEGSWSGDRNGRSAQVTVAGDAIGFFWGYDYYDPKNPRFSSRGENLNFVFKGGTATLTRKGAHSATLVVKESTAVTRIEMTKY